MRVDYKIRVYTLLYFFKRVENLIIIYPRKTHTKNKEKKMKKTKINFYNK